MELQAAKLVLNTFDDNFSNLIQLVLACFFIFFLLEELAQFVVFNVARELALSKVSACSVFIRSLHEGDDIVDDSFPIVGLLGLFNLSDDIDTAITIARSIYVLNLDSLFSDVILTFFIFDDRVFE